MGERAGSTRRSVAVAFAIVAAVSLAAAGGAGANNLDKRTMTKVAKQVAKIDCKDTKGCVDWRVRGLHRVSRHKGLGKINLKVVRDGGRFGCTRQVVIKLDHVTGEILYGLSRRRCEPAGAG